MTLHTDGFVSHIGAAGDHALWINGSYFVFRREIFNYIEAGEELVEEPFQRLIVQRKSLGFNWRGFWRCLDTVKDKIAFDRMEGRDDCPWMVWRHASNGAIPHAHPQNRLPNVPTEEESLSTDPPNLPIA